MAKETLLKAASGDSNIITLNGVTYFKLQPGFPGDFTKNCGLTGDEVDKNFYFLRGYDIDTIELDGDSNLTITRVDKNYEPIVLNIGSSIENPTFSLDRESGILTITFADGEVQTVEGFLVDYASSTVFTDETLRGIGSHSNRLGISPVERTGFYAPVTKLVDISNGDNMPDSTTCGVGYRVVTKEAVDVYGYLYKYSGAMMLQEMLENEGSEWHIPTREEWDEMLNAFECANKRNHSAESEGSFGDKAGVALKSAGTTRDGDGPWLFPNNYEYCGNNNSGLAIQPVGGGGGQRNTIIGDDDGDIEGAGKMGYYWTTSEDGNHVYVKVFSYDTGGVNQKSISKDDYAAIRLVKDYNGEAINNYENILGLDYPVRLVYGLYDDYEYSRLWTQINVYDDSPELNGIHTTLNGENPYIYCVCEWDGKNWVKKTMNEGDSVVITSHNDTEYRIINGVLVDVLAGVNGDISDGFNNVGDEIDDINARITEIDNRVIQNTTNITNIETNISNIVDSINTDISNIEEEINNLKTSDININNSIDDLSDKLSTLSSSTENGLEELDGEDIKGGNYTIYKDEKLILERKNGNTDIKIGVSDDFFNLAGDTEKRLQFRQVGDAIFADRNQALNSVETIINTPQVFGAGKVGEPIIARYYDNNEVEVILAIGTEDGNQKRYHIIDTHGIEISIENLNSEIQSLVNSSSADLSSVITMIEAETVRATNAENDLQNSISNVNLTLNNTINTLSGSVESNYATKVELTNAVANIENELEEHAIEEAGYRILDVACEDNQVYLEKANGDRTTGFPISKILAGSIITRIDFDEANGKLIFVFGDRDSTRIEVDVHDLVDVYTINQDSTNFLHIADNKIGAYVNNENGRFNTLATTNYVDSAKTSAIKIAKINADNEITAASGRIMTEVDMKCHLLNDKISANTQAIQILNGNVDVHGSVKETIDDALIWEGPRRNDIPVQTDIPSLMRSVIYSNGEVQYFVSNSAKDMLYYPTDDSNTELNEYIRGLHARISYLENIIGNSGDTTRIVNLIKNTVAEYLSGTPQEIKITPNNDHLVVGFADDAIFGPLAYN